MSGFTSLKSAMDHFTQSNSIESLLDHGALNDSAILHAFEEADENVSYNSPACTPDKRAYVDGENDDASAVAAAAAADDDDAAAAEDDDDKAAQAEEEQPPNWLAPPPCTMWALAREPLAADTTTTTMDELVTYPPAEDCWLDDEDVGYTELYATMDELDAYLPPSATRFARQEANDDATMTSQTTATKEEDESTLLQALIGDEDEDFAAYKLPTEEMNIRFVFAPQRVLISAVKHDGYFDKGANLGGRYRVVRALGEGSFSNVFECEDLDNKGEAVAIKQVRNDDSITFLQSVSELKVLIELNEHDRQQNKVVRLLDKFFWQERLYIVTELLGENLYDLYQKAEAGDRRAMMALGGKGNLKRMARQICEALAFVHSHGIVHADIKPENIVLRRGSGGGVRVKLIDFGCACFGTEQDLPSYVVSRPYRAPEIILGVRYDARIDVWAMAAVLFELSEGSVLFHADSNERLLARIAGICGPVPRWMIDQGRLSEQMFRGDVLFEARPPEDGDVERVSVLYPRPCTLEMRVRRSNDAGFVAFLRQLLVVDMHERPTAKEALQLDWLHTPAATAD